MTTESRHPPIHIEFVDEPVEAPCPNCGMMMQTTKIWRNYTDDWQPTDDIESLDKCDSCYAKFKMKWAAHDAEIARMDAEAEARRQAILARALASRPPERQTEFDFGQE